MPNLPTIFGTTPSAPGTTLGSTIGQGVVWTPQQYSDWITQFNATPAGQAAQRARDQTAEINRREVLEKIKAERDRIAVQQGEMEANRWYQRKQIELLRDDHAIQREKLAFDRERMGLDEAFRRDELGINTQLRAAELGSQLRGPRNYPFYLEAADQIAGSNVSNLLANQPGIGPMNPGFTPQRQTLASVLGDFGMSGQGIPGGAAPAPGGGGVGLSRLGLTDQDAQQLHTYYRNPIKQPGGWWASKNEPQREYLRGLAEYWGYDPAQIEAEGANARPRQGSVFQAAPA